MKITRRPAKDSDKDWIRDTSRKSYHDVVIRQFGAFNEEKTADFFARMWSNGHIEILICDGEPCGFCIILARPDHIFVDELVLRSEFQRRGIGSGVLREVLREADLKGMPVKLKVLKKSEAQALYKRLGFAEYGGDDTHILMEYKPR